MNRPGCRVYAGLIYISTQLIALANRSTAQMAICHEMHGHIRMIEKELGRRDHSKTENPQRSAASKPGRAFNEHCSCCQTVGIDSTGFAHSELF
jgi:hypothetical protein